MSEISGNKQRLLIVDDSKVIRVTARKILHNHFETVEAIDGNNAWDILTSQDPFSLIVSDLTMPNLDGFGLLKKIRSSHLPHVRNIPVIIITGANDSEATMQRATAAGATDFIGKPFDSVHLLARTQAHADSYAANIALAEENISLEDRSLVDPLTGLANDTSFLEQGRAQLAYAIRHDTTLALASLEIDDFGELVREHDTEAAELVIKSVGSALAANIRKEDLAARTGTARFALLLPGMTESGVSRLTKRISGDIGKHAVIVAGRQVRFTVSIGIATPEIRPGTDFDELLGAASSSLKLAIANRTIADEPYPDATAQDSADMPGEWTLESFADSGTSHGPEQDAAMPDIEGVLIEIPEPELEAELDAEIEALTLEDEIQVDVVMESTASARRETAPETDTAIYDVEETIIITSPYSLFGLDEVELASPEETVDSAAGSVSSTASDSQPAQAPESATIHGPASAAAATVADDTETKADRPGAFRRLMRVLFGRRD